MCNPEQHEEANESRDNGEPKGQVIEVHSAMQPPSSDLLDQNLALYEKTKAQAHTIENLEKALAEEVERRVTQEVEFAAIRQALAQCLELADRLIAPVHESDTGGRGVLERLEPFKPENQAPREADEDATPVLDTGT